MLNNKYNGLHLKSINNGCKSGVRRYTYDATGNRTAYRVGGRSYPYMVAATSNILTKVAGPTAQTLAYDAAGNLTKDGTSTYTYSDRGRLASATSNRITSNYFINGLGQRVKKTVGATTSLFMYDESGQLLGEYNSAGTALYETVYLDEQPVAVLKPAISTSGFKAYYLYADHLNTPRLVTDNAAGTANKKVWQWDSDPFGITPPNENPAAAGVFTYNPRFPGQVYDKETGLHYNYFRDYNPGTGRYVQSDPIGLAGGMNTFGYVGGNPLSFTDPTGKVVFIPPAIVWGIPIIGGALWGLSRPGTNGGATAYDPGYTPGQWPPIVPPTDIPERWPKDPKGQCIKLYETCKNFNWSGNCNACLSRCLAEEEWPFHICDGPKGCKL